MIVFDQVTKRYNDTIALDNINLTIDPGEFVFLVGHSGAGKTTLAKLLIREIAPSQGTIQIGEFLLNKIRNREIPVLRRQIGVIFQDFKLLNDRTAAENIAIGLEILGKTDKSIKATVDELLKVTGLEGKGHHFPREMSGGELQRVVIARALAMEPAVIFADEPTGNLDDETTWQIADLLERINQEGTALIVATHNSELVKRMKKRVITLDKGKIVKDTKDEVLTNESDNPPASDPEPAEKPAKKTTKKKSESKSE